MGATYAVTIDAAGMPYVVRLDSPDVAIDSLLIDSPDATLWQRSAELAVTGIAEVRQGTFLIDEVFTGPNILVDPGGLLRVNNSGELRGVTIDGDVDLIRARIRGGLTLNGTGFMNAFAWQLIFLENDVLSGGTIEMSNGQVKLDQGNTVTFDSTATVRGWGFVGEKESGPFNPQATLVNEGLILADSPGQILQLEPQNLDNVGTLEARDGGVLEIRDANWQSSGVLRATNGGVLNLRGTFFTPTGTLDTSGGTTKINGVMDNTGTMLTLDASTGSWVLDSDGRIVGGVVELLDGTSLRVDDGRFAELSGVDVFGDIVIGAANDGGNGLSIDSGLNLTGTLTMLGDEPILRFPGDQTFAGGSIVFSPDLASSCIIEMDPGDTLTLAAGSVIEGGRATVAKDPGQTGSPPLNRLVNHGTIRASVSGRTIDIVPEQFDNGAAGVCEAINGATLNLLGPVAGDSFTTVRDLTSLGVLRAGAGSTLRLGGRMVSTALAGLENQGGVVLLAGQVDNSASTLTLDGPLNTITFEQAGLSSGVLGGTLIEGGTVELVNGAEIEVPPGMSGALDGLVLDGSMHVDGRLYLQDSSFLGTLEVDGELSIDPESVPESRLEIGTIELDGNIGADNLVIAPNFVLRAARGNILRPFGSSGPRGDVRVEGLLEVVGPVGILAVSKNLENHGTIEVKTGGTLRLQPDPLNPTENLGTISVDSEGTLITWTNDLQQAAIGVIELADVHAASVARVDSPIQVDGEAALDGTLRVALRAGYLPVAGDSINVLSAQFTSGTFQTLDAPDLRPIGLTWQPVVQAQTVRIDVIAFCAGDANGDSAVDFDDVTTVLANWLADYSPGTGPGDANGDGFVNFDDLTSVLSRWLGACP